MLGRNITMRTGYRTRLSTLLSCSAGAMLTATSAYLSAAHAQQDTGLQAGATADQLEEIVVTGSRIKRTDLEAVSPVVTLGEFEVDQRGVLRVEDLLNTLPQAFAAEGSNLSSLSSGTASVDLRGLGTNRTLVLKDGKRLPFGSPRDVGADLNQIPAQLIERVEVLTGGASSIYGADAVAGVVNFVMKRNFQGLEADFQGSFFQSGNDSSLIRPVLSDFNQPIPGSDISGRSLDVNVVIGTNFADGRGNVTGWFNYANDNPVLQGDRTVSGCVLGVRNDGDDFACVGSTSAFPGQFTNLGTADNPDDNFTLTLDPQGTDGRDADGDGVTGLRDFDGLRDTFNFGPDNFFQRPRERFSFGSSGYYELADNHEFFIDFSFMNNDTTAQLAPSANFFVTNSINCDNPLLSEDQVATFCAPSNTFVDANGVERGNLTIGRRNVEGGPRRVKMEFTTFRVVGGFRGQVAEGFDYELFGQFGNTNLTELANDLNRARIAQAIDVVTDPVTGQPVCRDPSGGCVPWDIFTVNPDGTSNVSAEAVEFLTLPLQTQAQTNQAVFGGNITGDLGRFGITSPFADSGIQAVLGFEYRRDRLEQNPDFVGQEFLAASTFANRDAVEGKIAVYEFFGELEVPLVENAFLIEDLTANAAYRFADYTLTTGTNNTYTAGLNWAPSQDLRARAQFARAVRAPNPVELFSPQTIGNVDLVEGPNGLFDPCAGDFDPATPTPEPAASFAECQRTGVTAEEFGRIVDNPSGEFSGLFGGNPELDTEKANTWTAGVILTPRFAPGLTMSIDWFSINVKRAIGQISPNLILDGCLESGAAVLCDLVQRGRGGTLFVKDGTNFIQSTSLNTGSEQTKGVDVDLGYNLDLADTGLRNAGSVNFRWVGTWLDKLVTRPLPDALEPLVAPEEAKFDCAGLFGNRCGTPAPEFRWRLTATWQTPWQLDVTTTWRFFDSTRRFGPGPSVDEKFESISYLDLSAHYQLFDSTQLRIGVNNLFDKDPPLSSSVGVGAGNGNTFPQVFDSLGRFVFAGVNVSF